MQETLIAVSPTALARLLCRHCKDMGWVTDGTEVVRPFFPGGDFERHHYPEECVVVDNPPFSIYSKVVRWFVAHGVRFLMAVKRVESEKAQLTLF